MIKNLFAATLFFSLFLFTGCPKSPEPPAVPEASLGRGFEPLGMEIVSAGSRQLTGRTENHELKFRVGSAGVFIDGVPVIMPQAVTLSPTNEWNIPDASAEFIVPVLKKELPEIRTILLDPGHGGRDNGAVSIHRMKEKDLNLLLAHAIAIELKKAGFQVFFTRTDDRYLTLDERPAMIGKHRADLFISIHHNSAVNPAAAGLEIFVLEPRTPEEKILTQKSVYTAFLLQKNLASINTFSGRGLKTARFKVLRLSSCPAILVEAGFLSHPAEAALLNTSYFRQKFAAAFAGTLKDAVSGGVKQQAL